MRYIYGETSPRTGMSFKEWMASDDHFGWAWKYRYVGKFRAIRSRIVRDH